MRTHSHASLAAGALILLSLGLPACSAAGDGPHSSHRAVTTAGSDPLAGYIVVDESNAQADWVRAQEVIETCMEAAGFQYVPQDYSPGFPPKSDLRSREWITEHGYGIVDGYFQAAVSDPNSEYVDTLSAAESDAYLATLMGTSSGSGKDQGCVGRSMHDAHPTADQKRPAILADAGKFRSALYTNPRITALYDEWTSCMREDGYTGQRNPGDPGDLPTKVETLIEKQRFGALEPSLLTEDPAVAKLKAEEVAQALADFDCAADMDYQKRFLTTFSDLEQDFITQHKGELEEAQLWLNQ